MKPKAGPRAFNIEAMRTACRMATETLRHAGSLIVPGMTSADIDDIVHNDTLKRGGYPAPLNYKGFPRSVCVSINDVACHGVPGPQVLNEGDVVNVDVTTVFDNHFGDTNATFIVGDVNNASPEALRLVAVTQRATDLGIDQVRPGTSLRSLGRTIQRFVEGEGMNVIREFGGHGIGTVFHKEPNVRHFDDPSDEGVVLGPGTIITVEPIVSLGTHAVDISLDGWTVRTLDGSWTAQFEHTVLVTEDGCEVLTRGNVE